MSHAIQGLTPSLAQKLSVFVGQKSSNLGRYVGVEKLPVDIPGLDFGKGNRFTNATTLLKKLEDNGGYDEGLFRPVSVVRIPMTFAAPWLATLSKTERDFFSRGIIDDYLYIRWDGDHRHWLYKIANGEFLDNQGQQIEWGNLKYDSIVYETDDIKNANLLFVKIQKTLVKNLTPEEFFVNMFLSGDPDAIATAAILKAAGMQVKAAGVSAGDDKGFIVKIRDAQRMIRMATEFKGGVFETGDAKKGTLQTWSSSPNDTIVSLLSEVVDFHRNTFNTPEMFSVFTHGVLLLRITRPLMFTNGTYNSLQKYVNAATSVVGGKSNAPMKVVTMLKQLGGNQHNAEGESFAFGLGSGYHGSGFSTAAYNKNVMIGSLKEDLGL